MFKKLSNEVSVVYKSISTAIEEAALFHFTPKLSIVVKCFIQVLNQDFIGP